MKLFQRLLVAPAALGLMAPIAATAAELNINDVSSYSTSGTATQSISDFSDVHPSDWAFQALNNLRVRHGCTAASPNSSMTRYEAAALLNKCLSEVAQVNEEEQLLIDEFGAELAVINGRLDGLESDLDGFEAGVFSSTTKLSGTTKFVIGGVEGGNGGTRATNNESTTFTYDTIINLESSFSGDDLLVTSLRAGNIGNPFGTAGVATLETGNDSGDAVRINRNYYQFPVGDDVTATVGAMVRQDDMLAVWPSAYPSDSVLDVLTYAGANDAYNLALGAGAGLTYQRDNFSGSLSVVSEEAADANVQTGGVWTASGSDVITTQLAYSGEGWTVAAVYTADDGGISDSALANANRYTSWGLSGVYEIDNDSKFIPSSISAGLGWTNPDKTDEDGADNVDNDNTGNTSDDVEDTNTWSIGLLWNDAFYDGNTLGFAYGTAEGHRDDASYSEPMAYEIYYSMAVSDNITVTPAIFSIDAEGEDTVQGALVKTTFTF